MVRLRARADTNQAEIVEALRKAGSSVLHLHQLGHGVPDILVFRAGSYYLMEIKDGNKPNSAQKLTPDEAEWHRAWSGPVHIVHSIKEALAVVKA